MTISCRRIMSISPNVLNLALLGPVGMAYVVPMIHLPQMSLSPLATDGCCSHGWRLSGVGYKPTIGMGQTRPLEEDKRGR